MLIKLKIFLLNLLLTTLWTVYSRKKFLLDNRKKANITDEVLKYIDLMEFEEASR